MTVGSLTVFLAYLTRFFKPVEDLAKSVAAYGKLGYHVHQSGAWGDVGKPGSGQYAYMDTDSAGGISVELIRSY